MKSYHEWCLAINSRSQLVVLPHFCSLGITLVSSETLHDLALVLVAAFISKHEELVHSTAQSLPLNKACKQRPDSKVFGFNCASNMRELASSRIQFRTVLILHVAILVSYSMPAVMIVFMALLLNTVTCTKIKQKLTAENSRSVSE